MLLKISNFCKSEQFKLSTHMLAHTIVQQLVKVVKINFLINSFYL